MSSGDDAGASAQKTTVQRLDELFAPWKRTDAPGMTVGIAQGGQVLYRRAFGMASLETAVANTPKTRMRIGSTTKQFTCLLTLLLAEEGKLDIDAPIGTYIPELSPAAGEPTLRLLMQHRGGSRCFLDIGPIANGFQSVIRRGGPLRLQARQRGRNFAPGEAMIYNNGGYHLLSLAIQRVGGASFAEQLKTRLFEPLGMTDTELVVSDFEITPGIATLHVTLPDGRLRRGLFGNEEGLGEGAIVSTIDDMLRWAAHLRSRDRIGTPDIWEAMTARPVYSDGSRGIYALGLFIDSYRGTPTIHHGGSVVGGNSQMLTAPDHALDIVILANGAPAASPMKLAEQVLDIVLADQLAEVDPPTMAKEYESFLGDWWSPETGMVYNLFEEASELKGGLCNVPGGFLLKSTSVNQVIMPPFANGEIIFTHESADPEALWIRFGTETAKYTRLSKEYAHASEFNAAALGDYYSHDCDGVARISLEGERILVRISGEYGYVESIATCVGEKVALMEPKSTEMGGWGALTFERDGDLMTNFRLSNWRTRNLEFIRVQDKGAVKRFGPGAVSLLAAEVA